MFNTNLKMNTSSHPSPNEPSSDGQPSDADDAILDVLLTEAFGGPDDRVKPPDQTQIILDRYHASSSARLPIRLRDSSSSRSSGRSQQRSNWWWIGSLIAGVVLIAGSLATAMPDRLGLALRPRPAQLLPDRPPTDAEPIATAGSTSKTDHAIGNENQPNPRVEGSSDPASTGQLKRRVLELAEDPVSEPTDPSQLPPKPSTKDSATTKNSLAAADVRANQPARSIQLVSQAMQSHLDRYWQRSDIRPTAMMSESETADRIFDRFGVRIASQDVRNPAAILETLRSPENSRTIALRLMATLSSRPVTSLGNDIDQAMVGQLADTLTRKTNQSATTNQSSRVDRLVASWLMPFEQETEHKFPTPMGHLLRDVPPHQKLVTTVSLTFQNDMRCLRCHNMPPSGSADEDQVEYWRFAASTLPLLDPMTKSDQQMFYDTSDGRRKLAIPDPNWTPTQDHLIGTDSLAGGLVDWVWRSIHDRPLVATAYDLSGAANSEMTKLRADLTEDLIANDFDLMRTVALVMTDSILGRQVPDAMTDAGLLVADDQKWIDAIVAVDSFAASAPLSTPTSQAVRTRLVAEVALPNLNLFAPGESILAQPLGLSESGSIPSPSANRPNVSDEITQAKKAGLPVRQTIVMPAWIERLPTFESRAEHIAYLSGKLEVSEAASKLVDQMKAIQVEEGLILQRLWWILRP